ncbi:MAG: DNA repair protein RecO [Prevotella sp.]|nr:DNA repair protein RecO [Prevotella sp.]
MLTKTEALVLRHVKYGDNRMIVDLFTRECGRMSFTATVSRGGRGSVRRQMLCPLSLIEAECDISKRTRLQKLRAVRLATPLPALSTDPRKLSIGMFVAEFLCHALRDEQQGGRLFDYISDCLQWLDSREEGFANFHLVFLMRLSRFLGFFPNLDGYVRGCCFDLRSGCFCTTAPLHRDVLLPQEAALIGLMMRMNFSTMHLFRMSRMERNRMVEVIIQYYRIHIPEFPELRSLDVLRELFR